MANLKESSIKIGAGENRVKLNCVTETSDQYNKPITSNVQTTINKTKNQELRTYLKGHHFDFGVKGARTTQNKNQPYLRSDLSGPKSGLAFERSNQELKKD